MFRALAVAALLLFATATAEHTQTDSDHEASFEHIAGNEWWVEVDVDHDGDLHGVDARDDGGAWLPLEKKSWGVWAGSFRIEPGHDVQFRAHQGDFGRIASCWFSHPEGVERCHSDWHVTEVDRADWPLDSAIADVDNDGAEELVVSTSDGVRIYAFDNGWRLQETLAPGESFGDISTGDLDADGHTDVVVETFFLSDDEFARFEHDGTAWHRLDYTGPASVASAMTVGDPDGDGVDAVYTAAHGPEVPVYEVRLVDGAWQETEITRVSEGVDVLHVGDGDGDGDDELYAGGGYKGDDSLFQIEYADGAWSKTQIGAEHGSSSVFDIGTGDVDGDGRSELYHTSADPDFDRDGSEYSLWRNAFDGTWSQESVATFLAPDYPRTSLVADGDNDGTDEVYVAVTGGHDLRIIQVEKTATGWSQDRVVVANGGGEPRLAAGDPDQDGLTELASIEKRQGGFVQVFSEHAPGSGDTTTSPFTFDHTGSNEWWVQVRITGQEPGRVQAMDTDGPWKELEKKDWGDWAASFHLESGHDARFRAMVDSTWHESCWFTHPGGQTPDGGETCSTSGEEPPPPPPPSGDFDATFRTSGGNEWWVEAYVDANEDLAGVDARDDGGAWIALEQKSWGAWAKSFHVEDGSLVDFRATNTDGDVDISGQYRWPSGEQVTGEPDDGQDPQPGPSTTDVAFGPKAGNEWWVETLVVSNGTVDRVEARADGGPWNMLTLRDWGAWAGSFHVPMGSTVEFRATSDGGADVSDGFLWPEADAVGGDGSWPEEGSYLQYEIWDRQPGGYRDEGTLTMVRHDGAWWSLHQWTETRHGEVTGDDQQFEDGRCPSYGPTDGVAVGDDVVFTNCTGSPGNATVREMRSDDLRLEGDAATIDVWYATDRDPCNCQERQWAWDDDFGLVTYANWAGRGENGLEIEDTDAPLR